MENIIKIYHRFTLSNVKLRVLPTILMVQNIILSLIVLIYANYIILNGKINGEYEYEQIRFFYSFVIIILFVIICLVSPYLSANSINKLVKNNVIEHMLSVNIKISDVTFAAFLRGLFSTIVIFTSALPISCISFYFGGFGVAKFLKLVVCLILLSIFLCSICVFISSNVVDLNFSMILAYIICAFVTAINIYFYRALIGNNFLLICYSVLVITISLILIALSKRGRVFGV